MGHSPSDRQRVSRMTRGEKVIYWLGVEAQALADHLDEVPTSLAAVEALEDEVSRCQAKVAVREALEQFRTLRCRLHVAIAKLTELHDLLETNDPSVCVPTGTGETAMPRSRCGFAPDSA